MDEASRSFLRRWVRPGAVMLPLLAVSLSGCIAVYWSPPPRVDGGSPDGLSIVPPEPFDGGWDGGGFDAGDACHIDCFGSATCYGGLVVAEIGAPVPCALWTGACPTLPAYRCEKGCAQEGRFEGRYDLQPEVLCAEGAPKSVGSPCETDQDCLPAPATYDVDAGVLRNVYLQCDMGAGVCVEAPPAELDGWLGDCGLPFEHDPQSPRPGSGTQGIIPAGTCPGGACIFAAYPGETCIRQGCTGPCEGDHDCPPGATCSAQVTYPDGVERSVCRIWAPGSPAAGLSCF